MPAAPWITMWPSTMIPVEVEVDHKKSAEWISPKRPLKVEATGAAKGGASALHLPCFFAFRAVA